MSSIASSADAAAFRDQLDREGKKLVFTNGCFDLLHAGHVRYLQQARDLGDALIVALNSDASVRQLKGPSRPVNHEQDRAEIMRALRCVDCVVVFEEPRVSRLAREIRPHIWAKGGDYSLDTLDPEDRVAMEAVGARIELLSLVEGKSTTNTLKKLSQSENQTQATAPLCEN